MKAVNCTVAFMFYAFGVIQHQNPEMVLRSNKKWEEFESNDLAIRTNVVLKTHCMLIFHIWSTKVFTILFTGKVGDKVILLLMILEFQFLHGFKLFILFTYFKTVFCFCFATFPPHVNTFGQQHLVFFYILITMGMSHQDLIWW